MGTRISTMFVSGTVLLVYCYSPHALGQISTNVCLPLVNEKLIDERSESQVRQISSTQFNYLCSESSSFEKRFKSSGSSFQASFSDFASSLGIGGGNNSVSGYSRSEFSAICTQGSATFADFMASQSRSTSGAHVASMYTDCATALIQAQITYLTGTIGNVSGSDDSFYAVFEYFPGRDGAQMVDLEAVNGSPVTCFRSAADIASGESLFSSGEKYRLVGKGAITCVGEAGQPASGAFEFTAEGSNKSYTVEYDFVPSVLLEELDEKYSRRYLGEVSELRNEVGIAIDGSVQTGEVAFFNRSDCPKGWKHFNNLDGRTVVGTTNSNAVGDVQKTSDVSIKRDHLPKVSLQIPTRGYQSNQAVKGHYYPSDHPYAVMASDDKGNYKHHQRPTEFMGKGQKLEMPLPKHVKLMACEKT